MRFEVEQNQRGGWCVRADGFGRPLAWHDTEEDALAHANELEHDPPVAELSAQLNAAAEHVRLPGGGELCVRPVSPVDREVFIAGFAHLGEDSRYSRFLYAKGALTERDVQFFTDIDHEDHEAIGALDAATGDGVGVARMLRTEEDRSVAEAAVAVVDEWQGRGVGGVLLERLTARARELGVERFQATVRTSNRAMVTLFGKVGSVEVVERSGPSSSLIVKLPIDGLGGALSTALRSAAAGVLEAAASDA
jgi:GNAT superfamily N-acetyltransferase